jgi:hypothetical protein
VQGAGIFGETELKRMAHTFTRQLRFTSTQFHTAVNRSGKLTNSSSIPFLLARFAPLAPLDPLIAPALCEGLLPQSVYHTAGGTGYLALAKLAQMLATESPAEQPDTPQKLSGL